MLKLDLTQFIKNEYKHTMSVKKIITQNFLMVKILKIKY